MEAADLVNTRFLPIFRSFLYFLATQSSTVFGVFVPLDFLALFAL